MISICLFDSHAHNYSTIISVPKARKVLFSAKTRTFLMVEYNTAEISPKKANWDSILLKCYSLQGHAN